MAITAEEKDMLLQPMVASEFATKIVLASTDAVDVSPFEVESILHGLRLINDISNQPKETAVEAGLPEDNQELVNIICNAADARENAKVYKDTVLYLTHMLKDVEQTVGADDPKAAELKKMIKGYWNSASNCSKKYNEAFNKAMSLLFA